MAKNLERMTLEEKKEYLEQLKKEIAKLEGDIKTLDNKNMSSETAGKIVSLGWEHITDMEPKPGSYFHLFSNFLVNLTIVKSPLEVEGVWLAMLWSHIEDKEFILPDSYGYAPDKLGRYQITTEEELVKFASDVTKFLDDKYAGKDKEKILEEIVMRRFGKKVGTK